MKTYNFGNLNPPTPLANLEGETASDALLSFLGRGISPLVN